MLPLMSTRNRHLIHSLSISRFIKFSPKTEILDIGTGGGFPGLPLAILFPDLKFYLIDKIGKKINSNPNLKPALDAFGFSGLEFGKVGGKVTSKLPIKITEENIKSMPKGTNVQVGDTGKGELDSNGNILSFEKTDVANKKKDGQAQIILDNNVRILSDIDNFLADPDLSKATGMSGFVTGSIPGGKAYTTRAKLKTLQAQQAFGALQEMRQASATGASGLGQVSERELSLLESTIASLDPNISDEAFVENLNKFKNELTRINSRIYSERPDLSPTPLVQGASQQGSFNQNAIQQSLPDENPPSTNERDPLGIF